MDMTLGYFTIPRGPTDSEIARWYNAPGGRSIIVPARSERHHASCLMHLHEKDRTRASGRRLAEGLSSGSASRVPDGRRRVSLRAWAAAEDFYFDVLRQVKMERWSSGRVVLTGMPHGVLRRLAASALRFRFSADTSLPANSPRPPT